MQEQIVVRVPDGTIDRLRRRAERNERTLSQEMRLLIRRLLEEEEIPTQRRAA